MASRALPSRCHHFCFGSVLRGELRRVRAWAYTNSREFSQQPSVRMLTNQRRNSTEQPTSYFVRGARTSAPSPIHYSTRCHRSSLDLQLQSSYNYCQAHCYLRHSNYAAVHQLSMHSDDCHWTCRQRYRKNVAADLGTPVHCAHYCTTC
jgi:hypothetical protein